MKLLNRELIFPLDDAPTPSCHASTICRNADGALLSAWFGGSRESADDVEIWLSRRGADSVAWEKPVQMSAPSECACWNPVLYADGNRVTLFFKRSKKIAHWQTFVRRSEDGGRTWTEEAELIPGDDSGGRGPVKNKPILLTDGTIIAGASHESEDASRWDAFCDRSSDGGFSWTRTDYLRTEPYVKLIQPTLWQDENGVHALLRSAAGWLYRADSADGIHWSDAFPTGMPNNNSGVDLTRLPDGTLALVCNPVGENWGARSPLSLFLSSDGGQSWQKELDLAEGEGEYSYPAVQWTGERLEITFTYRRRGVMWCELA